jgi:hypothetical protein
MGDQQRLRPTSSPPRAGRRHVGTVGDFKSERWATSARNRGRHILGITRDMTPEFALCDLATMADCCQFAAAPAGMPHLCARTFAPLTDFSPNLLISHALPIDSGQVGLVRRDLLGWCSASINASGAGRLGLSGPTSAPNSDLADHGRITAACAASGDICNTDHPHPPRSRCHSPSLSAFP